MDLEKTGKFIAQLRKDQALTQEQLAEKIGVTNKTVSRWETGTYLPPADALVSLSGLFSVSINEILAGRRLEQGEYRAAAEENLQAVIHAGNFARKDRMEYFKKKWLREHIALMVLLGSAVLAVFAAGLALKNGVVTALSAVLLAVAHGVRHNAMMAYVEGHVYGGKG